MMRNKKGICTGDKKVEYLRCCIREQRDRKSKEITSYFVFLNSVVKGGKVTIRNIMTICSGGKRHSSSAPPEYIELPDGSRITKHIPFH